MPKTDYGHDHVHVHVDDDVLVIVDVDGFKSQTYPEHSSR